MARAVPGPRAAGSIRAFRFGLVGLTGVVVNQVVLVLLTEMAGLFYVASAIVATEVSTIWNFAWIDRWALAGRPPRNAAARLFAYAAVNNATLLLRLPLLWLLTEAAGISYGLSNLVTLGVLFALRFAVSDRWIWAPTSTAAAIAVGEFGEGPLMELPDELRPRAAEASLPKYRYDIGGIVRVDSEAELPELFYFRTSAITPPDIRIRIHLVGGWPSRRIRFTNGGERLTYREQLGVFGANFEITLGTPIDIAVSPLLARSRHVLYTNVVEALLRFTLVERGYVLLHSGCVAKDGKAILLSAQTDTGKTSTVIRLVRDFGYEFLSDDMTIVSPHGIALRYPKPMTMSYHTMSVIAGTKLPMARRAKLSVQSRVHSKSGRTIGRALGTRNIPIMAINSATQIAVPPPKFHITELLGCDVAERATIDRVVFIERGQPVTEPMSLKTTVAKLIENTDDAYGFPPFSTFAPHLTLGSYSYSELRQREVALLAQAIATADLLRLQVPGHGWAELVAGLEPREHAGIGSSPETAIGVIASATDIEKPQVELILGQN